MKTAIQGKENNPPAFHKNVLICILCLKYKIESETF